MIKSVNPQNEMTIQSSVLMEVHNSCNYEQYFLVQNSFFMRNGRGQMW